MGQAGAIGRTRTETGAAVSAKATTLVEASRRKFRRSWRFNICYSLAPKDHRRGQSVTVAATNSAVCRYHKDNTTSPEIFLSTSAPFVLAR